MAKPRNIPEFIKLFTEGKVKNLEQFRTYLVYEYGDLSVLQYKRVYEKTNYRGITSENKEEEILAYRFPDGSCICNANELRSTGHGTIYAAKSREGEKEIQKILQHYGAVPLPFTLFTESKLDVRDLSWICKPVAETVAVILEKHVWNNKKQDSEPVKESIDRHFVGSAIFKVENEIFFFDVDRQELAHGIFNAFITKLPRLAATSREAYDILMPDEVKTAISEGTDVKRQGEFFFIKVSDDAPEPPALSEEDIETLKCVPSRVGYIANEGLSEWTFNVRFNKFEDRELTTPERIAFNEAIDKYNKAEEKLRVRFPKQGSLGKSSSGSHQVQKYVEIGGIVYVSGSISQFRRQHANLTLTGWYKVVPNTGVFSWTITGRVD